MATDPSSLTQMHGKVDIHCTCKLMSQCTDACMKNLMGKRLSVHICICTSTRIAGAKPVAKHTVEIRCMCTC